ncbi:MAG TPA: DNA-binding protein [Candidatus Mediterraneibacter faecigallinarum]|jgi:flagellar biosynthesis GTPase FlhF|uniref:DNA-binding protein n=1 Tax=Candidatus Mediterraneibacter faecigallinarum TaxID=2838669 RepID=A0A9D2NY70_9FIRM|nr:DNA-binding protein [Candidatus Mediterraneibacter faecigallinarum]
MVAKKTSSATKAAAEKKETVKAADVKTAAAAPAEDKTAKKETSAAKAIETKKDTTKKIETKAGVLVDTPEEKAAEKKAPAKKTAAKKTAAKKAPAKKAELKTEMYLQFYGKEYSDKEILQKVKEIWTKVLKNKVGDMKDVKIYLKPEESKAYYVINGDTTGEVNL